MSRKFIFLMLIIFVLSPYANSAMLTFSFDDGHKSVYESAFPILSQYGFVGTANVISNYILAGYSNQMTIAQLLEMQSTGWEICSHSKSHPHFNKIPQSYQDEVIFNEWQKVSGMNYTYQSLTSYEYDELPFVVENGIPLKKKWSISGVENTPGSFYFDDVTKTLYIHTFNSDNPSNYEIRSDSVERELEMSKEELIALGFDVNNFIVPYSQWNEERALLATQYYNSVGAGYHNGYLNPIPFGDDYRYWLARRAVTLDTNVDEVIQWILEAMDEDAWLILMFHKIGEPPENDPWPTGWWSEENLEALASWVADQNILVVTQQQGLELAYVPIPSSLILMLSGIGILPLLRHKIKK